jgi:hypothetical protein
MVWLWKEGGGATAFGRCLFLVNTVVSLHFRLCAPIYFANVPVKQSRNKQPLEPLPLSNYEFREKCHTQKKESKSMEQYNVPLFWDY